jgi:hypothetical protein
MFTVVGAGKRGIHCQRAYCRQDDGRRRLLDYPNTATRSAATSLTKARAAQTLIGVARLGATRY